MTAITVSPYPAFRPRVFGARPFRTDGELMALRFAPDGSLWSVEEPGVLRHWDVGERRQIMWHELADPAALWCFSSSAYYVAAGSDEVCIWQTSDGELLACWPQASWVTALAFQAGGLLLASGHDDGVVRLWNYAGRRLVRELRAPLVPSSGSNVLAVSALAFSPDGRTLAVAAEDCGILLWDVMHGEPRGYLRGHTDRIPALAWLPDGRHLISAGWDAAARVWDTAACQSIALLDSHAGQIQALALTRDGQWLACASIVDSGWWMVGSGRVDLSTIHHPLSTIEACGPIGEVRSLTFSPDCRRLAFGGGDRVIHIRDTHASIVDGGWWIVDRSTLPPSTIHHPPSTIEGRTCLAVVSAGRRLASLDAGMSLRVWDTTTTETVLELEGAPALRAFAASPDSQWFAGSLARSEKIETARATLALWRTDTGRRERLHDGPAVPIAVLAFSPDSALLAAASRSGDVWLWTVPSGEPLPLPNVVEKCGIEALAFQPGGRLLAVGGIDWLAPCGVEGRIVLWDIRERRSIAVLLDGAGDLAFHPSGRFLAAATRTERVVVWDVETRQRRLEMSEHLDAVTCVAYSPDGRWLASGSEDRTVRLWDADSGASRGLAELDTQIKALAFAPDGRSLFTGNGTTSCYQLDVRRMLADI
jgi:WD40 repeat protein